MRKHFLLLLLSAWALNGCTSEEAPEPDTGAGGGCGNVQVNTAYVMSVIGPSCGERCHQGANAPRGADFSTPARVKSFISANENTFRLRVLSDQADMPPGNPLPKAVRDSIGCWISNGMPD